MCLHIVKLIIFLLSICQIFLSLMNKCSKKISALDKQDLVLRTNHLKSHVNFSFSFFFLKKFLKMERRKFKKRQTVLLFLFILIFSLTFLFFVISHFVFNCELKIVIAENFHEMEPEFLTNGTIYFMETHNSVDHQLTAREACAIESAGNYKVNI